MIIVDLKIQSHDVFGDIDYMVCRAQKTPPMGGGEQRRLTAAQETGRQRRPDIRLFVTSLLPSQL